MIGGVCSCVAGRKLNVFGMKRLLHTLDLQRMQFGKVTRQFPCLEPSLRYESCSKSSSLLLHVHPHSFTKSRFVFTGLPGLSREITKTDQTVTRLQIIGCHSTTQPYYPSYVPRRTIREDRKTTAVTLWSDLVQIKSSPFPALVLGLSGLIPFVCAPVYMVLCQAYLPTIAFAQTAYGAAILSFLGGVRWGITLPEESFNKPDWKNLSYSVVPSLIAWTGLLCSEPVSTLTIMTGLAGLAYFDTMMYGYPPWFKALRFILSIFAVLSLWTTFVCRFLLNTKKSVDKDEMVN